ncbi:MAG: ferredoxin [Candidatus Saganbacteria bacterium]|uniref:Ferredoxin n=1 Tax=Candidatus Saganbacteria bacterium TaxID=2575572 RepID=A0A833L0R1_UNCSA|nr:MAG: ferredoxin [Candidatus Saganbacteria bacterium]
MAINNVAIEDGCITCGVCESVCPEVFEMADIAKVKAGVDFNSFEAQLKDAADQCPLSIIKVS